MDRTGRTRREALAAETRGLIAQFERNCEVIARRIGTTEEHLLDYATLELTKRFIERRVRYDRSEFP